MTRLLIGIPLYGNCLFCGVWLDSLSRLKHDKRRYTNFRLYWNGTRFKVTCFDCANSTDAEKCRDHHLSDRESAWMFIKKGYVCPLSPDWEYWKGAIINR